MLLIAGALLGASGQARADRMGSLYAAPRRVVTRLPSGITRLTSFAYVYRPVSLPDRAPLLVLLHGAGGQASLVLDRYKPNADRRGAIVVALESTDVTWHIRPLANGYADFGSDPERLDVALTQLFSKANVDPNKIALLGFSDGASFALSLGLINPQLFRTIVAFSPGYAVIPPDVDRSQRLFIAHGRQDDILPFAHVVDDIVPALKAAGLEPHPYWFNGGHSVDDTVLNAALDFVLGPAPR